MPGHREPSRLEERHLGAEREGLAEHHAVETVSAIGEQQVAHRHDTEEDAALVGHEAVGDERALHQLPDSIDGLRHRDARGEDRVRRLHDPADGVGGIGQVVRPLPPVVGGGGGDHRLAALLPESEQDVLRHCRVERAEDRGDVRVQERDEEGGRLRRGEPRHLGSNRVSIHGTSVTGRESAR